MVRACNFESQQVNEAFAGVDGVVFAMNGEFCFRTRITLDWSKHLILVTCISFPFMNSGTDSSI